MTLGTASHPEAELEEHGGGVAGLNWRSMPMLRRLSMTAWCSTEDFGNEVDG